MMSYRDHALRIEAMVAEQVPFDEIETYIEDLFVPSEAKSALWLYAWAEQPRAERRAVVQSLELV